MADALDEARGLLARVSETEAEAQRTVRSADPEVFYPALLRRNAARMVLENECERLLPALCTELAALCTELALLREYHEASEAYEQALGARCEADVLAAALVGACPDYQELGLLRVKRIAARTALAAWKGRTK